MQKQDRVRITNKGFSTGRLYRIYIGGVIIRIYTPPRGLRPLPIKTIGSRCGRATHLELISTTMEKKAN